VSWLVKMLFGEESEKEAEEIIEIATSDPDGDIWDPQLPTTGEDPAIQLAEPSAPQEGERRGLLGRLFGH
jgi:hypothetical protein